MQPLRENVRLRVLLLVVVVSVIALVSFWVSLSASGREQLIDKLHLHAAYILGYCLPAIVIGTVVGWIKYSRTAWLWTTLYLLLATAGIYMWTASRSN